MEEPLQATQNLVRNHWYILLVGKDGLLIGQYCLLVGEDFYAESDRLAPGRRFPLCCCMTQVPAERKE
jgi:hypothetical protein